MESSVLLIIRIIHAAFAILFISCIIFIYYCALTRQYSPWLYPAGILLVLEGIAVALNKGNCPLEPIHLRYGDNKGFFGLFLPEKILPYVIPGLAIIAAVGGLLLIRINN